MKYMLICIFVLIIFSLRVEALIFNQLNVDMASFGTGTTLSTPLFSLSMDIRLSNKLSLGGHCHSLSWWTQQGEQENATKGLFTRYNASKIMYLSLGLCSTTAKLGLNEDIYPITPYTEFSMLIPVAFRYGINISFNSYIYQNGLIVPVFISGVMHLKEEKIYDKYFKLGVAALYNTTTEDRISQLGIYGGAFFKYK